MPYMEWTNSSLVGVPEIDVHHRHLFDLLNMSFDACLLTKQKDVLSTILKELDEYASYHFEAEEKLMVQDLYPTLAAHREQHAYFISKVAGLKEILSQVDEDCIIELVELTQTLIAWFSNHIQNVDKQYYIPANCQN